LDTAAIATFGGSDPLVVSRWYDQSGNLRDAVQITPGAQPQIYDGVSVLTENGKPAVSFDGGDVLRYTGITNTDLVTDDGHASSVVFKDTSTGGFKGVIGTDDRVIDFVTRLGNTDWQYSISTINTPELQYTASAGNYNVQNLSFVNKGASNAYWRLNASQIASAGGGGAVTPGTTNWELGESVGLKYQGLLQEVVVWNTDNDSSAPGIESNTNTYYSIYPTSGFLADYPGAAAAYSVRKLSNLATLALQVRRTSDNATQDIGFDSNGDLDTAAIAAFCGASPGTVSVWYDQSVNGLDATQVTPSLQPHIYDGAAVITQDGSPAIFSDSTNQMGLVTASTTWQDVAFTIKYSGTSNTSYNSAWGGSGVPNNSGFSVRNGDLNRGIYTYYDAANENYHNNNASPTAQQGTYIPALDTQGFYFLNGASNHTGTLSLFGRNQAANGMEGYMFEFVAWGEDKSSDRLAIASNTNQHFNVFTEYNPDAPTSGFLFDYSGAAVAYSVRQLNNNATYAMRVRRTVAPFDEQDIGFDGSGNLDTSAISTFGGSDSLTVSRWYDQTGNQNHATPRASSIQPTIYDGASVVTYAGQPAIEPIGTNAPEFELTSPTVSSQDWTYHMVVTTTAVGTNNAGFWSDGTNQSNNKLYHAPLRMGYTQAGTSASTSYGSFPANYSGCMVSLRNNTSVEFLRNNTSIGTVVTGAGAHTLTRLLSPANAAIQHRGNEYVIWPSILSSTDTTGIYNDADAYFSIP
jgi:hypothetical protein